MDWLDDEPCSSGAAAPATPALNLHDWLLCEGSSSGSAPIPSHVPTMDWLGEGAGPLTSHTSTQMDWADESAPHADNHNPQNCDWFDGSLHMAGVEPTPPSESPTLAVVPYELAAPKVHQDETALQVDGSARPPISHTLNNVFFFVYFGFRA